METSPTLPSPPILSIKQLTQHLQHMPSHNPSSRDKGKGKAGTRQRSRKVTLSNEQRRMLCEYSVVNPQVKQHELVEWMKEETGLTIGQSTCSTILANSAKYLHGAGYDD